MNYLTKAVAACVLAKYEGPLYRTEGKAELATMVEHLVEVGAMAWADAEGNLVEYPGICPDGFIAVFVDTVPALSKKARDILVLEATDAQYKPLNERPPLSSVGREFLSGLDLTPEAQKQIRYALNNFYTETFEYRSRLRRQLRDALKQIQLKEAVEVGPTPTLSPTPDELAEATHDKVMQRLQYAAPEEFELTSEMIMGYIKNLVRQVQS